MLSCSVRTTAGGGGGSVSSAAAGCRPPLGQMRRALVALALARPACCMKEQLSIEDDYRRIVVIDNFGFHKDGQINLKMTDLTVSAQQIHSAWQRGCCSLMTA